MLELELDELELDDELELLEEPELDDEPDELALEPELDAEAPPPPALVDAPEPPEWPPGVSNSAVSDPVAQATPTNTAVTR
ncbi:MAG: hypothetical protein HY744_10610 [Deltaproteobacteria bacterium]|nr:hypothetical protein [Deltaproteobacteria bacterium]